MRKIGRKKTDRATDRGRHIKTARQTDRERYREKSERQTDRKKRE